MGFLSNLFGFSNPQNASTDDKDSTWNRLFDEGHAIENDFNEFMIQHGITQDVYIFDVEFVNQGSAAVTAEKRRVDSLKGKILEFISEGGCAQYITNVDKMDEYLEKIRYMKEKDMMGIHTQFINSPLQEIKEIVESVERDHYADSISNTNNINSLSGAEFEVVCKQLIEKMGFHAELTKTSGDGGIDIIAYNHQPLLSGKYIIQCKRYSGSVGEPIIRDLYGVVTSERANKGILMTTGTFTAPAIRFAKGKPLELIDYPKLDFLFNQYGLTYLSSDSEEDTFNCPVDIAVNTFDWKSYLLENKLNWEGFLEDHEDFNFSSIPYIRQEEFEYWITRTQESPDDLIAYWKLLKICYSCFTKLTSESINTREFFSNEIDIVSDMIWFFTRPFLREEVSINTTNRAFNSIVFYSYLTLASCQIWNGNLFGAVMNWDFVVENWIYDTPYLKDMVIYSIISCMNTLGLSELAIKYYNEHKCDIEICNTIRRRVFSENEWLLKYHKAMYDCYCFWLKAKEIHEINTILNFAFPDLGEEEPDSICDEAKSCLISDVPTFLVQSETSLVLTKWEEPIENGKVINNIERCRFDRQKILEFFSSKSE